MYVQDGQGGSASFRVNEQLQMNVDGTPRNLLKGMLVQSLAFAIAVWSVPSDPDCPSLPGARRQ